MIKQWCFGSSYLNLIMQYIKFYYWHFSHTRQHSTFKQVIYEWLVAQFSSAVVFLIKIKN